eukprot:g6277.t1
MDIQADKLSKDRRFSMLRYVNPMTPLHEIERMQITDTSAWWWLGRLGTCLVSDTAVTKQVTSALECGYRVIDTAQRYGNEAGIGRALSVAFADGLVKRDEVFVTTKVWPANYGYEKAIDSVKDPALRDGLVKQIGISNYNERHLGELLDYAELRPSASQFEIHPFNTREKLVKRCQDEVFGIGDLGIRVNGYSPLGGKGNPNQVTDLLLQSPYLEDLGKQYGKTPAQIILRWHLQRDTTPIPKASTKSRLAENFNVFDFQLKEEEMATISSFDRKRFAVLNSEVRGLGGFSEEDTRRLAGIFLTPEALHRKAYSGKGLQSADFKRLRGAGFSDADLRRLGLLGYGLSEDEVARLQQAGFNAESLQRRLLSGEAFTKDEQSRLRIEGLPIERLRKLLAGAGKFSMGEKERLMRAGLPEMEVRRRLIGGEDFEEEELVRLDEVDLPLTELRRRILQDEIFSTEERLRLEVVGLDESAIQERLEQRARFTADELFSLESAGFDPEELHRRLHGESCFSPAELQRLELIGMSEEEVVRRLLAGEDLSEEELKWLEKGGFTKAKLIRRVFGTNNPKEDGTWDLSGSRSVEEPPDRLNNQNMAMALQRTGSCGRRSCGERSIADRTR